MLATSQRLGSGFGSMPTAWRNNLSGAAPTSCNSGTSSASRCSLCGCGIPTAQGNLQFGSNFGQYGAMGQGQQGQQAEQQQQMLGAMMQIMQVLLQLMQQMGQSGQGAGSSGGNAGINPWANNALGSAGQASSGSGQGNPTAAAASTKQVPKTINDFKLPDEPLGSAQLSQMVDYFAQRAGVTTDGLQQAQGQMFAAKAQRSLYGF